MLNIIFLSAIIGCNDPQELETAIPLTRDEISESLDRSAESLDNMIETSEQMLENYQTILNNQDAIFRAVTDCISEETCDALKESYTTNSN
tara:strand:+ start:387 stop:659 length:273 start_codon:yes stop_codon:yes gene_type:complete